MLPILLKYFYIIFTSFYLYKKLLNLTTSQKEFPIKFCSSCILCIIIYLIRINFSALSMFILSVLFLGITYFLYKQPINTTILYAIVSIVCSYALFMFSSLLQFPLHMIFVKNITNETILYSLNISIIGITEILISKSIFKLNRFKSGMPFLKQHIASDLSSFITISLLIASTFSSTTTGRNPYLLAPFFFIILSGILIFFWWKSKLTENYYKAAKDREIGELKAKIEELKSENATLSKIIHKDNKLIPAMLLSVNDTIVETYESADEAQRRRLAGIVEQLNEVAQERKGLVLFSEKEAKAHYSTGVPIIDNQLRFQAANAYAHQTCFEVMISNKLNIIVPDIISPQDLHTLVADLLTNALIAVKAKTKRNILFHTYIANDIFYIDFYDSGTPFDKEVLEKMGKERITTHGDDGGSGIGYMTTFEILHRCNGKLDIIEDLDLELYTKKVRVSFPLEFDN